MHRRVLKTFVCVLIMLCCSAEELFADFGWGDSPKFYVNLLTERGVHGFDYADSSNFSLNLLNIRRAWADSDSFTFDCLLNTQPSQGSLTPVPLPSGSLLEQYDSTTNQWVTPFSVPAAGQSVIVLNHGWNSSPAAMLALAQDISNRVSGIFIYTWDWGNGPDGANPNGLSTILDFGLLVGITPDMDWYLMNKQLVSSPLFFAELQQTMTNAAKHGVRLGDDLFSLGIRSDLHKIHLIGSSFGGVVCAEAAKVLKAKCNGAKVQQITTLDTPALYFPNAMSYVKAEYAQRVEVLYYDYRENLLMGATGGKLDGIFSNVLNFKLNPGYYPTILNFPLHFRVCDWYQESAGATILNCENDPYGFGWSVSLDPTNPNWFANFPAGDEEETLGGKGCLTPLSELVAREAIRAVEKVKDEFASAASWGGQKAQVVLETSAKGVVNSAVQLSLVNGGGTAMAQNLASEHTRFATDSGGDSNDAYIYKDINVPENVDQIAFDVKFTAVGQDDKLTLSIGDEILTILDAQSTGLSDDYQTFYAYVGNYAGQRATIQFALRATGAAQSTVLIDNLRFTTTTIDADINGDKVVNEADLLILTQNWLNVGCNFRDHCDGADINHDNNVDFLDYAILAASWMESF